MIVRNGMEHAKQWSREKCVWHHAIIDHADRFGLLGFGSSVIIELTPSGLQARLYDPRESWERTAIADDAGAAQRLRELLGMDERRLYHWLTNNCEHVARYIAWGEFKSEQIRGWVTVGLAALLLLSVAKR